MPGLGFRQVIGCGQASRFGDCRLVYGGCFGSAYRAQTHLQLGGEGRSDRPRSNNPMIQQSDDPTTQRSSEACAASTPKKQYKPAEGGGSVILNL